MSSCLFIVFFGIAESEAGSVSSLNDLPGTWDINYSVNLAVSGFGTIKYGSQISCDIVTKSPTAGTARCSESEEGDVISGSLSLAANGKKIIFSPDQAGLSNLKEAIKSAMVDWASAKDAYLDESSVTFNLSSVGVENIPVVGSAGHPELGKGTLKVKGTVSGNLDDQHTSRSFTYLATFAFKPFN